MTGLLHNCDDQQRRLSLSDLHPQLTQLITLARASATARAPAHALPAFAPKAAAEPGPIPAVPKPKRFSAERTGGSISRIAGNNLTTGQRVEIELPFGTPPVISAAAFKRLLGGSRSDTLLKKSGATWIICEDDLAVDLMDTSAQFRLGRVAVYS